MRKGFTLIELVVVIIILAILSITVIPRLVDIRGMRLDMALQKVAADLKYAQEFAMNHNCRTRVVFNAGAYTVYEYENSLGPWTVLTDPTTRENFIVSLNQGNYRGVVIVSATFDGGSEIQFDSIGAPYVSLNEPLSATGVVTLGAGTTQKSISVTPVTGRIYM